MKKLRLLYFIPLLSIFFSCATQVPPTGGIKDTIPPKVLKLIPDSFSTHFKSNNIAIIFNEFIELQSLNEQLVISPPLSSMPDMKVKSKTLLIHIDDTLKENKTYTFNFGNSIKDITEGNSLENFQYVFSTGAAVDTEQISGKVLNAFTQEPEKRVLVMLYDTQNDSLPYLDKPAYFSRTAEDGNFVIKNISKGNYKIFALKETNNNYLFDSRDESIAFKDNMISSGSDSIKLFLFTETLPQNLLRVAAAGPGKVIFAFQRPVDSLRYELMSGHPEIFAEEYSAARDTVSLWYKNISADSLFLKINSPLLPAGDTVMVPLVDTTKIKTSVKGSATSGRGGESSFKLTGQSNLSGNFNLNDSIRITFSHPIASWDSSQITLMEDSFKVSAAMQFSDILKRQMFIAVKWKEDKTYTLKIPPGVFTDVFGLKNDTLEVSFRTRPLNEYGTLKLDVGLDSLTGPMILQLLDEGGNISRQTYLEKSASVLYEYLLPGIYRFRIIYDENHNGKWDTGNYLQNRQAEKIMYHAQKINVRTNWDIEMEWTVLPESP